MTPESSLSDLPAHHGWIVVNTDALFYGAAQTLNAWDLTQKTTKVLIGDPGLRKVQMAGGSGRDVAWLGSVGSGGRFSRLKTFDSTHLGIWSVDLSTASLPILAIPTVSNGSVYLGADREVLSYAVDTGTLLWRRDIQAPVFDTVSFSSGMILAFSQTGVSAVRASEGLQIWSQQASGLGMAYYSRVVVTDGSIVCHTTADGRLAALELETGKALWSTPMGSRIDERHPPIVGPAGIMVPLISRLAFIDRSGKLLWERRYEFLASKASSPGFLMMRDTLLVAGADGLYALSLTDGNVMWKSAESSEVDGLLHKGGKIYASFRDGVLRIYPTGI